MSKGGGNNMQWVPTISSNNSTSENKIPEWLTAASQRGVNAATDLLNNPGQAYTGELTAGMNGIQNAVGSGLESLVGQAAPYFNAAGNAISGGMQAPMEIASGTYKNGLQGISDYMNPYINTVVNSVQGLSDQNLNRALTQTGDQALSAKAFGGSRHGVQEGVATAQNNLNTNNLVANLLNTGYNNATNLMGQDIGNTLTADRSNQGAFQNWMQNLLSGGNSLSKLGMDQQNTNTAALQNVMNYGNQVQQTQQNADTARYNEYLRMQNLPYQALQAYNTTAQGAPKSTSSSTSSSGQSYQQQQMPTSNPLMTGLGLAAGIGSMFIPGGQGVGVSLLANGLGGLLGGGNSSPYATVPTANASGGFTQNGQLMNPGGGRIVNGQVVI